MLIRVTSSRCLVALVCSHLLGAYAFAGDSDESGQSGRLDEVVVTATKRTENVQDVPLPVSVETAAQLIQSGYSSLVDYAANLPSVNIGSLGTPGQSQVSIRGISSTSAVSAVGVYVDDVAMGSSNGWANGATNLLDLTPYELDRIEVLRGPQGTLYGEGAMGGIIKYVLRTPSTTNFEGNVGADASTIDGARNAGYTVRARVNIPVINDVLGVSVGAFDKVSPGYMYNEFTGEADTNRVQEYGGRIAALWTPSSTVSVKLNFLTQVIQAADAYGEQFAGYNTIATPGGPLEIVPTNPLPDSTKDIAFPSEYSQHLNFGSATVNWKLDSFDLTSATSYSSQRSQRSLDFTPELDGYLKFLGDGTTLETFAGNYGLDKLVQEIRLNSTHGTTFDWLGGVFYSEEHSYNNQANPVYNTNFQLIPPYPLDFYTAAIPSVFKESAAFGNLTWRPIEAFDVTVGGRYAHNEQAFTNYVVPAGAFGLPPYTHYTVDENVFTWLGTAEYHLDKDTMVYVRAASGYRPGGLQAVAESQSYKSDSLINYELGLKSTFLDGTLRTNLAAYRIDWKDIQLTAITPTNVGYITNGGKAVSQGLELETLYSPVHGLTFGINAAYTDAELKSVIANASYLLTGYQLPFVPKETVAVTADYEWPLTGRWIAQVGGAYRYTGWQYLAPVEAASSRSSAPTVRIPGYSALDLHSSIREQHLTFSLYAHNLANSRALTGSNFLATTDGITRAQAVTITNLPPRTISMGVDYAF